MKAPHFSASRHVKCFSKPLMCESFLQRKVTEAITSADRGWDPPADCLASVLSRRYRVRW